MRLCPRSRFAVACLASFLAPVASAQSTAQRFAAGAVPPARFVDAQRKAKLAAAFPEIDRAFRAFAERTPVPGLAWGVIVDGELVHSGAVGVRDVAAGAAAKEDSVFRIASMTKSFTALAILKLRDQGRLSLEDPVARHVPELAALAYPTRDSPVLTIRHLLSHSEGFPEDNPWGDRQLAIPDARMSAWIRGGIPFSNAPGVAYEYSNYGFAILGQVVSRVSGSRNRDFIDREILKPLGMTVTRWEADGLGDRVAKGYGRDAEQWVLETPLADGSFGAMGGLYSSVPDLARYVSLFLSAWPPRDDADTGPVRRSSLREMQQTARPYRASARRAPIDADLVLRSGGYAYGLAATQTCRFAHVVAHSGGLPGYGSQMRWLPEHGVGLVALANRTYSSPGRPIDESLEALARTGALEPRVVQPSARLVAMREAVNGLIAGVDDAKWDQVAADNLYLDRAREKRKADLAELRTRHGACRPDGEIEAENALRGEWRLACERGTVRVTVTLAPTEPPRLQLLETTSMLPASEKLRAAATRLASAIGGAPDRVLSTLVALGADSAQTAKGVSAATAWGACRVGEVQSGGGNEATLRFHCDKGDLDARLALDDASGKLKTVTLIPAPTATCVP